LQYCSANETLHSIDGIFSAQLRCRPCLAPSKAASSALLCEKNPCQSERKLSLAEQYKCSPDYYRIKRKKNQVFYVKNKLQIYHACNACKKVVLRAY
jgi:hypothetical protein